MGDRCTGHCCQRFYLPLSPERLLAMWEEELAWSMDPSRKPYTPHQILTVAAMVIPLGQSPLDQNGEQMRYADTGKIVSEGESFYWYTCRNLTPGGDCGIYATRPAMCRDYPYGEKCRYNACTWSMRKASLPVHQRPAAGTTAMVHQRPTGCTALALRA